MQPALSVIWPDWAEGEKSRVLRTLCTSFPHADRVEIQPERLEEFVEFLSAHGLEAFFWRLRSFEEHALRGMGARLTGLRSDLQGLAICVEHLTHALGATGDQLYENLKQLWEGDATISAQLRAGATRRLVQDSRMLSDWTALAAAIDALRQGPGGAVLADLVWAARLRGAVHYTIPLRDQFELERLFVALMRAAALTFAESRRLR